MIPIFDEMGNILRWEDPYAGQTPVPEQPAGPSGVTPGPGVVAPVSPFGGGQSFPTRDTTKNVGTYQIVDTFAEPTPEAPPSGGDGGGSGDYGGGFTWPEFNAPVFDPGPAFVPPPAFEYAPFAVPTLDDAKNEPGYEFARSEGLRGLQNVAASRGVARTGGTLKDLIGWGNRFAEQNYGNVYNRAGQTYDRNRNNAADAYQTNYGVSRDVFDRTYGQRKDKFGFDYQGAKDMFAPKQRAAELTFSDLYARWKAELDANTSLATAGAGL